MARVVADRRLAEGFSTSRRSQRVLPKASPELASYVRIERELKAGGVRKTLVRCQLLLTSKEDGFRFLEDGNHCVA